MLSRENIIDEIRGMRNAHKRLTKQYFMEGSQVLARHHRIAELTLEALLDRLYEKDDSLNDKEELIGGE
jgi:hypothetical protein